MAYKKIGRVAFEMATTEYIIDYYKRKIKRLKEQHSEEKRILLQDLKNEIE